MKNNDEWQKGIRYKTQYYTQLDKYVHFVDLAERRQENSFKLIEIKYNKKLFKITDKFKEF